MSAQYFLRRSSATFGLTFKTLNQTLNRRITTNTSVSAQCSRKSYRNARSRLASIFPSIAVAVGVGAGLYLYGQERLSAKSILYAEAEAPELTSLEPITRREIPSSLRLQYDVNSPGGTPKQHEFEIVGLGARQVTFLNVSVYVLGLYIEKEALRKLQSSPLSSKYSTIDFLNWADDGLLVKGIVRRPDVELSLRIEPVRNTNGAHLRGGFMRFLQKRYAKEEKSLTPEERKDIVSNISEFNAKFPMGVVRTGESLVFTKLRNGHLRLELNGDEVMRIPCQWISERFMEYYLDKERPPSDKARRNIAEGFERLLSPKK
ncbi:hypothetical protein HK102_005808 [Quaeritorhiza haematococci]|nr:hypothetical protein HK102_005808 [Quaeritorhiza haematococci]